MNKRSNPMAMAALLMGSASRIVRNETPEQQKARQLRAEIHAHNLTVELKRKQRKERKS